MINILIACLTLLLTPGHVQRVIDGDTFVLYNVGVLAEERVRVLHINTPEMHDTSAVVRARAQVARDSTAAWLARGSFTISACSRDGFGRLLADVYRGTDTLAVDLVKWGLAVKYR